MNRNIQRFSIGRSSSLSQTQSKPFIDEWQTLQMEDILLHSQSSLLGCTNRSRNSSELCLPSIHFSLLCSYKLNFQLSEMFSDFEGTTSIRIRLTRICWIRLSLAVYNNCKSITIHRIWENFTYKSNKI